MWAFHDDSQAAKLVTMFREVKRRQSVGLSAFYGRKLAALEDALLAAREQLFAVDVDELASAITVASREDEPANAAENVAREQVSFE